MTHKTYFPWQNVILTTIQSLSKLYWKHFERIINHQVIVGWQLKQPKVFFLYFRRKCMCAKTFSALLHHFFCHWVCISPTDLHNFCNCWFKLNIYRPKSINLTMVGFIYILDSSNSSSFTLWSSISQWKILLLFNIK